MLTAAQLLVLLAFLDAHGRAPHELVRAVEAAHREAMAREDEECTSPN